MWIPSNGHTLSKLSKAILAKVKQTLAPAFPSVLERMKAKTTFVDKLNKQMYLVGQSFTPHLNLINGPRANYGSLDRSTAEVLTSGLRL